MQFTSARRFLFLSLTATLASEAGAFQSMKISPKLMNKNNGNAFSSSLRTLPMNRYHWRSNQFKYASTSSSSSSLHERVQKPLDASTMADMAESDMSKDNSNSKQLPFPIVLWRFTRPHTLIGSALAIPALHILAAPTFQQAFTKVTAISAIFAMIPSLLMNLYITGLNQITDVEIDKINKPNLPIAAGDLSPKMANVIVTISLIASLAMGVSHPVLGTQGLNVALWGSMILGTMYSLPPFRLKRFPLLAATCIVAVRGAIINAGFYAHAKATTAAIAGTAVGAGLGAATGAVRVVDTSVLGCLTGDARCFLSSLFFAVFGIVIALMKDVPDAAGDALFNIKSFTVRIGQKNVFTAGRRLLTALFFGVGAGFTRFALDTSASTTPTLKVCRLIVALSSFGAGISVRQKAQSVDAEDSGMVYKYYMHLWKLFYASYLVLPFAR